MLTEANAANVVWQLSHCALVGTWLVGLPRALVPLWHVEQRPPTAGVAAAWLKVAVAQVVVELWQLSHWAVVLIWVAGLACAFRVAKPPLWQLAHCPAMPA
jgi:hypothetical protein